MDFKDLSYVIAIAKTQNITKAADMLYVTQPTLTKFLQNLEREMGQKLFKKLGNRFVLTYAGERYVAKATEILNLKKELDQEMGDIIRQNAGLLKIAFPTMRGTYMLPCTLPIFRSLYPHVRLEIREAHSSLLEGMLSNGDADLAFFNLPVKSPDIDYQIISHEEVVLVLGNDHPLKNKGIKKEGCKYPWLDLKLWKMSLLSCSHRIKGPVKRWINCLNPAISILKYAFRPVTFLLLRNLPPGDMEPVL